MSSALRASQGHRAIIRKNRKRAFVIPQHKVLPLPFGENTKIRISHPHPLYRSSQQLVIHGLFHPYRQSEGAEKILICSIKQGIRLKIHIHSSISAYLTVSFSFFSFPSALPLPFTFGLFIIWAWTAFPKKPVVPLK